MPFYWERSPDGPFATLIRVAATYLEPENYDSDALKRLAKRDDDEEMRVFKSELRQALRDPSALALSAAGDRLALVALALLACDRTRSPFLAAVAWAAGALPYVTGLVFAALPGRAVMIGADLARAALTAVLALPGVPLPALIALMYLVGAAQPPFDAARSAAVRDVPDAGLYALGATVMQATWRLMII